MARIRSDRRTTLSVAAVVCVTAAIAAAITTVEPETRRRWLREQAEWTRPRLFDAIQPIKLTNCDFERFGESHDGGYLLCRNLLAGIRSGYSYGISGYDQWGCDVSTRLGVAVHEYDCFDLTRPVCTRGNMVFHAECVGGSRRSQEGRSFDTIEAQISRNGDTNQPLVVKIDVEGAEWDSLLATPAAILQMIDQLVIEFHGFDRPQYLALISKLKQYFYIVNLHWNNCGCSWGRPPFPSLTYEILFVNKRIGVPDRGERAVLPNPLDQPNRAGAPDCQIENPAPAVAAHGPAHTVRARP